MGCSQGTTVVSGIGDPSLTQSPLNANDKGAKDKGAKDKGGSVEDLPLEYRALPPFFTEILLDLMQHQKALGGLRNWQDYPRIDQKVKAEDFRKAYTDFEYVYLTVLGFARLHMHGQEIVQKSNGKAHHLNPGVQLLEITCGMTMHGDRPGAQALLRSAPSTLLEAFRLSRQIKRGGTLSFFKGAFDRTADPCLEGRVGRILEFLEKNRGKTLTSAGQAPWEDVSLAPLPASTPPDGVVGEHLRVFVNECTWRWAEERGMKYEDAKVVRQSDEHLQAFSKLYNAGTFRAAMIARGVVQEEFASVWEVATETNEGWSPFEANTSDVISAAKMQGKSQIEVRLGPKGWAYDIDFIRMVQRNRKTGRERPIRCVKKPMLQDTKMRWEVELDEGWTAFDATISQLISVAKQEGKSVVDVNSAGWTYEINFDSMVQRNRKTGKQRPIRCVEAPAGGGSADAVGLRKVTAKELEKTIARFIELETLPRAPPTVDID